MTSMEAVVRQHLNFVDTKTSLKEAFSGSSLTQVQLSRKVKPLQLPPVSLLDRQVNSLMMPGTGFSLKLVDSQWDACFVPDRDLGALPYRISMTLDQFPVSLELDRVLLQALLEGIAPDLPFDHIPAKLRLALIRAAAEPLIRQFGESTRIQADILDVDGEKPAFNDSSALGLRCRSGQTLGCARLTLTPSTFPLIRQFCRHDLPAGYQRSVETNALPVETQIVLNGPALSIREIHQLELHDIILLEQACPDIEQDHPIPVQLQAKGIPLFMANLSGANIEITHSIKSTDMKPQQSESAISAQLNDIPLAVTFELARQSMTIEQLQSLSPGQIFELDRPLHSPVVVLINGTAIAEAELVQINDQVGARITRIIQTDDLSQEPQP